jgi:hypothetical protein
MNALADADLRGVGRRAFGWVIDHLDWFRARVPGERGPVLRAKRLAELATLGGALADSTPGAAELIGFAWRELDDGEGLAALLDTTPAIASAYLPFLRTDLRSARLEARLTQPAWQAGHRRWPLFVRYAVGHVLEALGLRPPWDQGTVLVARDLFLPPTEATPTLDAALLAHVVMWRTDMGRDTGGLGVKTTAAFQRLVPTWIDLLTAKGELDPLGEILIANTYAGGPARAAAATALATAQRRDGSVPPVAVAMPLQPDALYHSTIVAAIATSGREPAAAEGILTAFGHLVD